jgi:hypothetical protein
VKRVAVGVLGGGAAALAGLVGAISLTRIAGDYLGFPPGFEWTFTGAVDVAGIAGGIMWTAFTGAVRKIGRPMNIVCTIVSGIGVGLDHATHAGKALREVSGNPALPGSVEVWPWIAFGAGLFVPLLVTWILHALSIIADAADHQAGSTTTRHPQSTTTRSDHQAPASGRHQATSHQDHQAGGRPSGDHQIPTTRTTSHQPGGDHQATTTKQSTDHQAATTRTTSSTTRALPAGTTSRPIAKSTRAATAPAPSPAAPSPAGRVLRAVPASRPGWLTDELRDRALTVIAEGGGRGKVGRGDLMEALEIKDWKARDLLKYIDEHGLARRSA